MTNGKMYKVLVPIERDGTTHWMRAGNAFTNKDESLNAYVDSVPISIFAGKQLKFQIREYDADELRRRDENRGRRGPGDAPLEPLDRGPNSIPF